MKRWGQLLGMLLLVGWLVAQPLPVQADGARVGAPTLVLNEDGAILTGHFSLSLSAPLIDAVNHGIPLVFQMEAEVRRPRWYWVDDTLFSGRTDRRLTYNALVRNYRVSDDQGGRNFVNLVDALNYLARPVSWRLPTGQPKAGEKVEVVIRFRLDPAFLPKPFQVFSFSDRDWRLDSDWRPFSLTVPVVAGGR